MKTKTLMIGLLLLTLIAAPLAMAVPKDCPLGEWGQGPRGGRGGGFGGGPGKGPMGQGGMGQFLLGRLGDKLELTDDQRAEIESIVATCKENQEATKGAVQEAMKALHEAAETGDEGAVADAAKVLADTFAQKALERAATKKAIETVLTDDQIAQLQELKAKMRERMQQRKESGRFGPRGGMGGQFGPRGGKRDYDGPYGGRRGMGGPRRGGRQGRGGQQCPLQERD